jgi:hypothetical protein
VATLRLVARVGVRRRNVISCSVLYVTVMIVFRTSLTYTRSESSERASTRDSRTSSCGGGVPGCVSAFRNASSVTPGMNTAPRQR